MTEDQFQQSAVIWIKNNYCLKTQTPRLILHSTPNGGSRNFLEAKKMKQTGTLPGVLDLTLKLPNSKFIDIELKIKGGVLSEAQKDMIERLELLNCNYIVAYDLEELKSKLIPMINNILNETQPITKKLQ